MADETVTIPDFEIFRAGRHVDSSGVAHVFSDADLSAIATAYDPKTAEAPIVVGHPASDGPAYGWVASVSFSDGRLIARPSDVDPAFADMVKARRFPKRSAAFYPQQHPSNPTPGKFYLRHVGFLGAQPPAVKGLRDIHFVDVNEMVAFEEVMNFNPSLQENPMSDDKNAKPAPAADPAPQAELAAMKAQFSEASAERDAAKNELASIKKQLAEIEARGREMRHAAHLAFAEAQVAAGHILPKDSASTVAVLDLLADAAPVEFTEGDATRKVSPVEFVKNLIESQQSGVQFGEFAPGKAGGQKPQGDAAIDAAARKIAAEKNISYDAALTAVVNAGA